MYALNQEINLSEYTKARNWAVEHGYTMQDAGGGKYKITALPPPDETETANALRAERNALLNASDWTQLPDSPLSAEQKRAWAEYRQTLRDIPRAESFPNVTLPVFAAE